MRYTVIFLSSFLLVGCVTSDRGDTTSSQKLDEASFVKVIHPLVVNTNVLTLNAQLQSDYSASQVQVLKVGNQIKVTYPSDLLFGVGSTGLLPSSQTSLDPLVSAIKAYPLATVRIDCFTDKSGSQEKNIIYTQERAQSVARYLIDSGLAADKMSLKGYGSDYPVASNESLDGREQNRRVVITISKIPAPPAAK